VAFPAALNRITPSNSGFDQHPLYGPFSPSSDHASLELRDQPMQGYAAYPGPDPTLAGTLPRAQQSPVAAHLPYWVLVGAVSFNAVLAFINGNVTTLSPAAVIAAELFFIGTAVAIALTHYRSKMAIPIAFIVWLFLFMILRSAIVDPASSIKFFRDVLIAPVFVMLGLCTDRRLLVPYLLFIHVLVVTIGALEAFNTPLYSSLFHIKSYFINTRGLSEENFWNTDSDLFVSATRTGSRFISWADNIMAAHRVSSIFLEPVSLGAYCIVIAGVTFSLWRSLSLITRTALLGSTFFLVVACDGRLAVASVFFVAAACACWRILPRAMPILYLPVILLLCFLFVSVTNQVSGNDDFPGRIAWTVELLKDFDVADLLGASDAHLDRAVDSGVGYLILSQSVFGLIIFWIYTSSATHYANREQICYTHAIALYVAFNALISYGFLSIKTAALIWMIRGVLEDRQTPPWLPPRHSEGLPTL
jgi:putative polymerase